MFRPLAVSILAALVACATNTPGADDAAKTVVAAPEAAAVPDAAAPAAEMPAPDAAATAALGQPAPNFSLTDLQGKTWSLSELKGKTVVLEWFNPGCPYVQAAYADDGALRGLAAKATEGGDVVWLAINSGAPGKQGHGKDTNMEAVQTWGMTQPVLLDEEGRVGRAYDAKTTPHMYIVDAAGTLVYAGGLDNAPMGRPESETLSPYFADALGAVRSGQPVRVASTKPYGCSVKYADS